MNYIGVDVSCATLDAEDEDFKLRRQVKNTRIGIQQLFRLLDRRFGLGNVLVVLEPTSTYHHALMNELATRGVAFNVINPARTKAYMKLLGRRAKTDKVDAHLLACLGRSLGLKAAPAPDPAREAVRMLRRHIASLEGQLYGAQAKLAAYRRSPWAPEEVIKSLDREIRGIEKELSGLERHLQTRISANPQMAKDAKLLRTVKGVGVKTTALVLSELPAPKDCARPGSWVAFAGISTDPQQSGNSQKPRISRMGSKTLRSSLYFAAIAATKHNPVVKAFYERLVNRGKPKKVALVAAMAKLLRICFGVLKNGMAFDAKYRSLRAAA